jgi:hypothetical protein
MLLIDVVQKVAGLKRLALALGCVALSVFNSAAMTGSIDLAWDPSPSTNVNGYFVYYGTESMAYTTILNVGSNNSFTITAPFLDGRNYYFAVTAYDSDGGISDFSNEISFYIPRVSVTNFTEAESGTVSAPMAIGQDANASNNQYVYSAAADSGTVSFNFDITEPDDYVLWARVLSPDSSAASFNVSLDGAAQDTFDTTSQYSPDWQWVRVNGRSSGHPRIFTLVAGSHTITFRGAGANTFLDSLYLSNDPLFAPPGASVLVIPPSMDQIAGAAFAHDGPPQTISLTGISGGSEAAGQTLSIRASSSNPGIVPTPVVNYTSPNSSGTLTLSPASGAFGNVTITVTLNAGSAGAVTRNFYVSVAQAIPIAPILTLVTNGHGSLTALPSLQKLVLGKPYSVTAIPAAGMEFAGWTGSTNTLSTKISFVVASNSPVRLQANFIPSPFIPAAGAYNGLFYQSDRVRLGQSGAFSMFVNPRGIYTGRLQLGAERHSFKGKLNLDLTATPTIVLKSAQSLNLNFRIGADTQAGHLTGQVSLSDWAANLTADRSTFTKLSPATFAGAYTVVFPSGTSETGPAPDGHGYGTIKVTPGGVAVCSGKLGDGTRISQSAQLSQNGSWPFFAPLYSGKGAMLGWIARADLPQTDLSGPLSWIKLPDPLAKFYPRGFDVLLDAAGSVFHAPSLSGQLPMSIPGTAEMNLAGGNLPNGFQSMFAMNGLPKVTDFSLNALSLSFSSSTGTFKGSVTDPTEHEKLPFAGVVLQKLNEAYGFAIGTNATSSVQILSHL